MTREKINVIEQGTKINKQIQNKNLQVIRRFSFSLKDSLMGVRVGGKDLGYTKTQQSTHTKMELLEDEFSQEGFNFFK